MQFLFWVILGMFAGLVVAIAMQDKKKSVIFFDVALGILGASLAGIMSQTTTVQQLSGFYNDTIFWAVITSGICIAIGRTMTMRRQQ